jgi:glutathione synthase
MIWSAARVASALSVATAMRIPSALGALAARLGFKVASCARRHAAIAAGRTGARLRGNRMRFVYVMDPVDRVVPDKDTTFALQRAAQRRGHASLHCLPRDLFALDGEVFARVRDLRVSDTAPFFAFGQPFDVRLADVEAVLIRKDPPFDVPYLYTTLLLERARDRTVLMNDPRGIRDANEKLYALHFARHMPRVLVTSSPERIYAFMTEVGGRCVIKPLSGAAGAGVLMLSEGDKNNRSIAETLTAEGRDEVMVQEYLPAVVAGDKRVLLLAGEVLGAINRVPRADDLRSNIHVGGRVEQCEVTPEERAIIRDMAPRLVADGLIFVGLDFIGGRLTEVNVTSPTGIQELSRHAGRDVAEDVIAWLEKRAHDMRPNVASMIPPA